MSNSTSLIITPKTRIGELLDTYPELEEVLLEISPSFQKLKNPVLRKTIGKVATLQQAATLGNASVNEIINMLRSKVGQELYLGVSDDSGINYTQPDWYDTALVTHTFDASPLINSGQNPMQEVFDHLDKAGEDKIFKLITPFVPAPIIDLIDKKGYAHYCVESGQDQFSTLFIRKPVETS